MEEVDELAKNMEMWQASMMMAANCGGPTSPGRNLVD